MKVDEHALVLIKNILHQ